ncbi:MAG: signal peptidase I [Candidatus Nanohaloarchaea archaeon]
MAQQNNWNLDNSAILKEVYFLAIALILAFGVIQTTGTLLNTDKPVVTVVSCSMYPKYTVGDVVVVQGEPFDNIKVGDIAVYNSRSELSIPVIHRVVEKRENSLETRGDNNRGQLEFEKNVTPEQIHGTALFSIPRVGAVKLLAMDLTGVGGVNTEYRNRPLRLENSYTCESIN